MSYGIDPVGMYQQSASYVDRILRGANPTDLPCCSRLDLYMQHAGIDIRDIFPPDEAMWSQAKIDTWNWDTYLSSAEKLYKAGYPVGLPMGQTADSVDWVGALFRSYGA